MGSMAEGGGERGTWTYGIFQQWRFFRKKTNKQINKNTNLWDEVKAWGQSPHYPGKSLTYPTRWLASSRSSILTLFIGPYNKWPKSLSVAIDDSVCFSLYLPKVLCYKLRNKMKTCGRNFKKGFRKHRSRRSQLLPLQWPHAWVQASQSELTSSPQTPVPSASKDSVGISRTLAPRQMTSWQRTA